MGRMGFEMIEAGRSGEISGAKPASGGRRQTS